MISTHYKSLGIKCGSYESAMNFRKHKFPLLRGIPISKKETHQQIEMKGDTFCSDSFIFCYPKDIINMATLNKATLKNCNIKQSNIKAQHENATSKHNMKTQH
jgi:hypothetical protein